MTRDLSWQPWPDHQREGLLGKGNIIVLLYEKFGIIASISQVCYNDSNVQNSKTPHSIAEREFGGAKQNTLIETIVRHFPGASFASVCAFVFEEVDNIVNKYGYLFMDLVV